MNLSKIFLAFLLSCGTSFYCYGQDLPLKSVLIDRFAHESCEAVFGRMDSFFIELLRDPASRAFIIIYPSKDHFGEGFQSERRIKAFIEFRRFDKTRITIIRGETRGLTQVDFWQTAAGANPPPVVPRDWGAPKYDLNKPFIFYTEFPENVCPTFLPEDYADLLTNNPDIRSHIVIFNKPKGEAQKEADKWLKIFTKDNKIDRSRFRIFFSKSSGPMDKELEFWIVPVKKK
jgi:hypothetical protein